MVIQLYIWVLFICIVSKCQSFQSYSYLRRTKLSSCVHKCHDSTLPTFLKNPVINQNHGLLLHMNNANIVASLDSVYRDSRSEKVTSLMDIILPKLFSIASNPIVLVFAVYFVLFGYIQVWNIISSILSVVGLKKRDIIDKSEAIEELPFQVFECEVCEMQMRPAKGRASKIFSRDKFRCARCGSKASSYFNIDDMTDKRAVARLEKLKNAELDDLQDD